MDDDEDDPDKNPKHQYQELVRHVATIIEGKVSVESKRERKLRARACLNVAKTDDLIADPRLPPWSHRDINFSRVDQWATILKPGHFALVLSPCINKEQFDRVLIDGGSSIDILFKNSLSALNISEADLKPYDAQFWGVLPGQSSTPLGQITLPVQFGTADHFRTNYVNFVVADFEGTYHAILGHPAITSSWPYLITGTWCSRCQRKRESSLSEVTYLLPITVKRTAFA
jgi:hypothetical protein